MFNLKQIRMDAKRPEENSTEKPASRAELVEMLAGMGHKIHETQIGRYEDNPESIPYPLLRDWLKCLGTSIEQEEALLNAPKPLNFGDPYRDVKSRIELLEAYLAHAPIKGGASYEKSPVLANSTPSVPGPTQIEILIAALKTKPNLVLSGRFDSAKSTLANHLNGNQTLPTGYQPITRVITYVRHLEDRPAWLKSEKVLILRAGFDPAHWDDEAHIQGVLEEAGSYDLLNDYAAHEGAKAEAPAEAAIVFIDSPILRTCNIIDLPGFSHDDRDSSLALAEIAARSMDALIYLSPFNGFLDGEDTARLRALLPSLRVIEKESSSLPPLSNLLIVASHADSGKSDSDINSAFERAAKRLLRNLEGELATRSSDSGKAIGAEELLARMAPFWRELPERRASLEEKIQVLLKEHLPMIAHEKFDGIVSSFKRSSNLRISKAIASFKRYQTSFEEMKRLFRQKMASEPARRLEVSKMQMEATDTLGTIQNSHVSVVQDACRHWFTASVIEEAIRENFDDKKDAQQHLINFLLSRVDNESTRFMKKHEKLISATINKVLDTYDQAMVEEEGSLSVDIDFDSKAAFLSGMAGAGTWGALALWAGTLGNLGSYIIAAKMVSALSAIGISVGGTAAAMSFIAAIGGPFTLGLASALLAGLLFFSLFGQSWQAKLAKKAADELRKNEIEAKFVGAIKKYWKDTHTAFMEGLKEVEAQYQEQLRRMEDAVEDQARTVADAAEAVELLEEVKRFFAGIPWVPLSPPKALSSPNE